MEPGTKLGPYEILGRLGAGGMGEVYRARDRNLERHVAIKVLPAAFAVDSERMARFAREAKLLASLEHPNIAVVYGLEEWQGTRYLAQELIDGESLAQRIKRGRLGVDEALEICRQIAAALEAAHAKSIVHRDLKPANVMLTSEGRAKVLDFGLAKPIVGDQEGDPEVDLGESPTLTTTRVREGVVMGTAAYMSPRQARRHLGVRVCPLRGPHRGLRVLRRHSARHPRRGRARRARLECPAGTDAVAHPAAAEALLAEKAAAATAAHR